MCGPALQLSTRVSKKNKIVELITDPTIVL